MTPRCCRRGGVLYRYGLRIRDPRLVESAKGACIGKWPRGYAGGAALHGSRTCLPPFKEEIPVFPDDFSTLLNYRILGGGWERIAELTPGWMPVSERAQPCPSPFEEWIRALKTKAAHLHPGQPGAFTSDSGYTGVRYLPL